MLKYYLLALGIISVITFFAYAIDKSKARRGAWRTPEKVLLGLSFFGGALGGSLAMALCRHKTKHWYFVAVNAIGLLWQAIVLIALAV